MRVKKVISNNAALAIRDDEEVVVLGRGVGFGVKNGDEVDQDRVERVFLADDGSSERLSAMLADLPLGCLRAAGRIADLAHDKLGVRVSQALILPLADHLAFAEQRARDGVTIAFPLMWEVSQLYPKEHEIGREAVHIADEVLEVTLDPDEAVAIAMHLVNIQFATPGHTNAVKMTETIATIIDVVEKTFNMCIDRHSMDCARFVTHLRYVFARVASDRQIAESHPTLFDALTATHPEAMQCAAKVRYFIEVAFGTTLGIDETAYLGVHIARLLADQEARPHLDTT
ncbi:PRD domain-containing protein [Corynebacterium glyciniphilum]|uniref:PRD domain-containing protein n=1 Tax=Corynebacterium glyciniphilum TaxID=1404244 RepID=UPI003DA0DB0B